MKDRLKRTNVRKTSHRLKRACLGLSLFALAFSAVSVAYIIHANAHPESNPFEATFTIQYEGDGNPDNVLNQGF